MIVLGLTGSIAMGKSTTAAALRRLQIPVHDSDAVVHRLLSRGGAAVAAVAREFPDVVTDGAVDRRLLGNRVFSDPAALRRLEQIVHPLVRADKRRFMAAQVRRGAKLVVLDVPLLFEGGQSREVDAILVVTAPRFLQTQRALRRPGMSQEKLAGIRARQMPDLEKRRRADFVLHTGLSRGAAERSLRQILRAARRLPQGRPLDE